MTAERKRHAHEAIGKVLHNEETGLSYVPYERVSATAFYTVVVGEDKKGIYKVGGYNLVAFIDDVENDTELVLS